MVFRKTIKKNAAMIFSGGGLGGLSQLGAYKLIEEYTRNNDIKIQTFVGTSFGSVLAGLLAIGFTADNLIDYAKKSQFKLIGIKDIKLRKNYILGHRKIIKELLKLFEYKCFSDLGKDIELIINTVDIRTGTELLFTKKGLIDAKTKKIVVEKNFKLIDAILASTAIPAIFTPMKVDKYLLVDGGLITPLGLKHIDQGKYNKIFAIDVCTSNFSFLPTDILKEPGKLQLIQQTISIAQRQYHKPDITKILKQDKKKRIILINPKIGPVKIKRKKEVNRIIKIGYKSSKEIIDKL